MLLKQSNPEHATNTGTMSPRSLSPSDTARHPIPHNDPLDDVFGADNSPVFDQDFDDDESRPMDFSDRHHPSDMHRLQQEHTTAGYRDGIAVAKASSIQAGFDEGFSLGGTIGLKVGRLLGLLEGIVGALGGENDTTSESEAATKLLSDARVDLDLRSMFSPKFWNEDGTWKYEVDEKEAEGEGVVLFSHVAEAHPLVKKWTATVAEQMSKWGLQEQLPLLQRSGDEDRVALEPAAKAKASTQSQSEAKAPSDALSW
ncbi:Essential protein Yae1, N terminal [Gnomoniopsis smithogilvyi]|uniref:Protein YAE1 n=1 Tax=Gnomoniopsis smithogilvyi TaxID=1191159 RepID=A0A9W9D2X0_9PEZI|nr:Essential protein Yae1, N terminal [Gnomoniopsis smithogilvyi]